jgi:nitric oxide dioxygenase
MLTQQVKTIIKSTAPLLREHGDAIAVRTYEILFEKYPQTNLLFSKAPKNQANKLASVIIGYCENIDNLPALSEQLDAIAQRHVKMDVHPGHYTMMGHSLMQAIKEILQDDATVEVLAAWKTAYYYLADQLIERERALSVEKK